MSLFVATIDYHAPRELGTRVFRRQETVSADSTDEALQVLAEIVDPYCDANNLSYALRVDRIA